VFSSPGWIFCPGQDSNRQRQSRKGKLQAEPEAMIMIYIPELTLKRNTYNKYCNKNLFHPGKKKCKTHF
jgi:hypothetical protein